MKKLVIYGAGGLGREVKSMLHALPEPYELIGFLDDGRKVGSAIENIEILGGIKWLESCPENTYAVLAIGDPKVKGTVFRQIQPEWKVKFATIIHPRATIQNRGLVSIGEGSIIGAGSVLTTGIQVGRHVLINLNTTIGHDSSIGDFSSIMPGVNIAGNVIIGKETMIGSGANVINSIKIGELAVIGAGSVVNHDIPAAATAAGVPARIIKHHGIV